MFQNARRCLRTGCWIPVQGLSRFRATRSRKKLGWHSLDQFGPRKDARQHLRDRIDEVWATKNHQVPNKVYTNTLKYNVNKSNNIWELDSCYFDRLGLHFAIHLQNEAQQRSFRLAFAILKFLVLTAQLQTLKAESAALLNWIGMRDGLVFVHFVGAKTYRQTRLWNGPWFIEICNPFPQNLVASKGWWSMSCSQQQSKTASMSWQWLCHSEIFRG